MSAFDEPLVEIEGGNLIETFSNDKIIPLSSRLTTDASDPRNEFNNKLTTEVEINTIGIKKKKNKRRKKLKNENNLLSMEDEDDIIGDGSAKTSEFEKEDDGDADDEGGFIQKDTCFPENANSDDIYMILPNLSINSHVNKKPNNCEPHNYESNTNNSIISLSTDTSSSNDKISSSFRKNNATYNSPKKEVACMSKSTETSIGINSSPRSDIKNQESHLKQLELETNVSVFTGNNDADEICFVPEVEFDTAHGEENREQQPLLGGRGFSNNSDSMWQLQNSPNTFPEK